jgi:TPR repeat protein
VEAASSRWQGHLFLRRPLGINQLRLIPMPKKVGFNSNALSALLKKAEHGDAESQYSLGCRYYSGKGVLRDYKESAKWFLLAAEQGKVKA